MEKNLINLDELKNIQNSICECEKDLYSMLDMDLNDLPEDFKRSLIPLVDLSVLEQYLELRGILKQLVNISESLCNMIDDEVYKDYNV